MNPCKIIAKTPREAQEDIYKQRGEKFIITTFKDTIKEGQAYF